MNQQYGEMATPAEQEQTQKDEHDDQMSSILAINPKNLDWEAEMRKHFGSSVVGSSKKKGKKRFILVSQKDTWPRGSAATGLSMHLVDPLHCIYSLHHSKNYEVLEFTFYQCIATHNPDTIHQVLRENPYHLVSLLQLSEVFKSQGDVSMAGDFIERILYAFEASFHSAFNIYLGKSRLDFNRIESRPVFVALFRHIQYLSRKSCWKTALEFLKILFALEPSEDPFAAVLLIDFYAIRSESFEWYMQYWNLFQESKGLDHLPSACYSKAICQWELESKALQNHQESTKLLEQAISRFPSVVVGLLGKLSLTDSMLENAYFAFEGIDNMHELTLRLLIDMYIESSHSFWKVPEILTWLKTTSKIAFEANMTPNPLSKNCPFPLSLGLPLNLQRMVVLSDDDTNFVSYLPSGTLDNLMAFDPLPPATSQKSVYDAVRDPSLDPDSTSNEGGILNYFMNFFGARNPVDRNEPPPSDED